MSFVKIWVHVVFGTKDRQPMLMKPIRERLFAHIDKNAHVKGIYINCIGGYNDHIHILLSLGKEQDIAKTVNLLKGESSHWMNAQTLVRGKFEWADEYFAVSIGDSQVERVRSYINNQEEHHRTKSYAEEYLEFLQKYDFEKLGKALRF